MKPDRKSLLRNGLALIFGALLPLAFAPFHAWWLAPPLLGLTFLLSRQLSAKPAAWLGFAFGVGMFGVGTSWVYVSIHEYGAASPLLAGGLTLLFVLGISLLLVVPAFWLYGFINKKRNLSLWQQALLFAGLWLLAEWMRTWLLTGFPWLLLGYSVIDTPLAGLAPVTGVFGLSLVLALSSTVIAALLLPSRDDKRPLYVVLALLLVVVASAVALHGKTWTQKTGEQSFAAIQANIPQNLKWDPSYINATVNKYVEMSESHWGEQLLIWPENALPVFHSQARKFLEQLRRFAQQQNTALLLGLPVDDNDTFPPRYYNGVISLGEGHGVYKKQRLVPFGEYVPLESMLRGLFGFFNLPMSAFSAGGSDQSMLRGFDEIQITPYICYEVVYPDFAANMAQGSDLLVTVSNDTWFGRSIGPLQHFQIVRMRALETGRFMIRVTNDGLTALVNDQGDTVSTIPRFKEGVLTGTAELREGATPFMVTGSAPVLLLSAALVLLSFARRRAKR